MVTLTERAIMKSRSGVYSDTSENRRKHRVGQKYGSEKQPEDGEKTEKKETDPAKELEAVNKVISAINEGKLNLPATEAMKLSEIKQKLETKLKRDKKSDKNEEPKKESETKSQPQKERVSLSGWESNSLSDVKKYGEEGVVSSMSVQAVPNLKEMKYEYSASVSASRIAFDESEEFGTESEKLREKKFNSPNEAAKAAEEFALKWNSEKQKGSDVNLSRKGKEEKPKDDKSDPKQGEAEEYYTRVKFDDIPNSGKVNLKKYLSEKMKKSADEAWGDITKIDTKDLQKMEKGLVEDFNRQFDDLPKSRRAEKLYAIMKVKGELSKRDKEEQKEEIPRTDSLSEKESQIKENENDSFLKKDFDKKELKKEVNKKKEELINDTINKLQSLTYEDLLQNGLDDPKLNRKILTINSQTFYFYNQESFDEQKNKNLELLRNNPSMFFNLETQAKSAIKLENFNFQKAQKLMNFKNLEDVKIFQSLNSKIENSEYSEEEIQEMKSFYKEGFDKFYKTETEGKHFTSVEVINQKIESFNLAAYQADVASKALGVSSHGFGNKKDEEFIVNSILMEKGYLPIMDGSLFKTYKGEEFKEFRYDIENGFDNYLKRSERALSKSQDENLKKSLISYSEGKAYIKIRKFLSGETNEISKPTEKTMKSVENFLENSSLEENTILYRRLGLDEKSEEGLNRLNDFYNLKIGDTFEDKSFGSFSEVPLSTFGKDFQITLLASKGSKVAPIGNKLSNREREFLTQKGMKFKVVARGTNSIAVEIINE